MADAHQIILEIKIFPLFRLEQYTMCIAKVFVTFYCRKRQLKQHCFGVKQYIITIELN
jgi:hypothetical protein